MCRPCYPGCTERGSSCKKSQADCKQCRYFRLPTLSGDPEDHLCTPDDKCLTGFYYLKGEESKPDSKGFGKELLCVPCDKNCLE